MKIEYKTATDLSLVIALHKQIFNEDNQSFFNSIKTRDYYKTFVATHNQQPVAYCIISVVAGEAEIINIGTNKQFRQQNIASNLLNYALQNIDAQVVFLEVSNTNIPAIQLYKKCGFTEYGIRKNYYGHSDAILMKKQMN